MPNGPKGGLDRRDFMILALGSVGATAAASVNADAAMAQDATVSSAVPGTVYTGDLSRLLDYLGIDSTAMLGYSHGGAIASAWLYVFGQFVDHDLDLEATPLTNPAISITIPPGDPFFPAGTSIQM